MRLIGCLLMVSGWLLSLAALVLLTGDGGRVAFVAAALVVEGLGLGAVAYAYRVKRGEL